MNVAMSQPTSIRINKYLSEVGYCSRRAADGLLEQNRITINGKIPELGTQVFPTDEVRVDGQLIGKPKQQHVYIAFNKPVGIVSTQIPKEKRIISSILFGIPNAFSLSEDWIKTAKV